MRGPSTSGSGPDGQAVPAASPVVKPSVETVVLIGGPCRGEFREVQGGAQHVVARDAEGNRHVYVRSGLADVDGNVRTEIFRVAVPSTRH